MRRRILVLLLVLAIMLCVTSTALAYTAADSEQITALRGTATIDGRVDTVYGAARKTVELASGSGVRETIYLCNDDTYLYYCGVLTGVDWTGSQATTIQLLVGEYTQYRGINAFEWGGVWYERCAKMNLALDASGNASGSLESLGVDGTQPASDDYRFRYDANKGTMTYEIRFHRRHMAFSEDATKVVVSSSIVLPDGSRLNWYDTAQNKVMGGWDGIANADAWDHVCATVTLGKSSGNLLRARVMKVNEDVDIDGIVTGQEWGTEIFSGRGWRENAATRYIPWLYENDVSGVNYDDVTYKVYALWDDDYLYLAAVIDNWNWTKTDTSFKVMTSPYDERTTVEEFVYENAIYNRLFAAKYSADINNNTHTMENSAVGHSQGVNDYRARWNRDYAINWSDGNHMGYEVRIPWRNIDETYAPAASREYAFSAAVTVSKHKDNSTSGNVYNWERGAMEGLGYSTHLVENKAVVLRLVNDTAVPIIPPAAAGDDTRLGLIIGLAAGSAILLAVGIVLSRKRGKQTA